MYIKKTCGYLLDQLSGDTDVCKGLLDVFIPEAIQSTIWKYWRAILDPKLCVNCLSHHGKIYAKDEIPEFEPPLHDNCRCAILPMNAIVPGNATKDGENGADYWLACYGNLPHYYISDSELRGLGWKNGKSPQRFAPGRMYSKGIYNNDNGHLPSAPGRIWYEADINYYEGRRNGHRILYSNDGLLFVTYDHYLTFYEIIIGGL